MIKRIVVECVKNPTYIFREVLRVPAKSGSANLQYRASRANMAALWLFLNKVMTYIIQPRQTGKSIFIYGLETVLLSILTENTLIHHFTKDATLREETVDTIKAMIKALPPYIRYFN